MSAQQFLDQAQHLIDVGVAVRVRPRLHDAFVYQIAERVHHAAVDLGRTHIHADAQHSVIHRAHDFPFALKVGVVQRRAGILEQTPDLGRVVGVVFDVQLDAQ